MPDVAGAIDERRDLMDVDFDHRLGGQIPEGIHEVALLVTVPVFDDLPLCLVLSLRDLLSGAEHLADAHEPVGDCAHCGHVVGVVENIGEELLLIALLLTAYVPKELELVAI